MDVEKTVISDYNWTVNHSKALKVIEERCGALCWIHNRTSVIYKIIHITIVTLFGVITTACGGSLFPIIFNSSLTGLVIAMIVILIVVGGLTTAFNGFGLSDKAIHHKEIANDYGKIHITCSQFLQKDVSDRDSAIEFISSQYNEMINLDTANRSVKIPRYVYYFYYKKFKLNALPIKLLKLRVKSINKNQLISTLSNLNVENKKTSRRCCGFKKHEPIIIPQKVTNTSFIDKLSQFSTESDMHEVKEYMQKYSLRKTGMKYLRPKKSNSAQLEYEMNRIN